MTRSSSGPRLRTIALVSTLLALVGLPVLATEPVNSSFTGVALGGYDAVAYFTAGKPVKGSKEFSFEYKGATWRFATQANLESFRAAPDKYAPQYGGYCAWAVSEGKIANGDPQHWKIVDGKLYLNYDADVQKRWEKDIPGHISRAEVQWPKLLAK